jgi:hypothetical protein
MIIPTGADDPRMTTAKRQTLADFMYYSLCSGQSKAGPYGYSPLPLNLVQAGFQQLAKLKKADPAVDLTNRDVTKCNNPTFVAGNLSQNHLAQIAPQPAACDKEGDGPCGTATGTNQPSTDDPGSSPSDGPTDGSSANNGGGSSGSGPPGGANPSGGTTIDPETGAVIAGDGSTASGDAIYANPTELVSGRPADTRTFGLLAALELLALVLVPGLYVAAMRRRRTAKPGPRP